MQSNQTHSWIRRIGVVLPCVALLAFAQLVSAQSIPRPEDVIGFKVGTDRKLADYNQIIEYFERLSAASDRIDLRRLGKTTEGNDFVMAVISSPENLARLEEYRGMLRRLSDPRKLKPEEAERLIDRARTVVLINCALHSTEVGATQMSMELAYGLATRNDSEVKEILDNVITLLVPSHNPDGQLKVVDWYRRYLGTEYEGSSMPWLYQKYTGHDNNRDWFMFTQAETRITVEKIHNVWFPQITVDMHQMGRNGARLFIPPYIDPYEPNIDPILISEISALGTYVQSQLTAQGKAGVVTNAIFDAWTPARAYPHYHGGIRFLTEAASVKIATPVEIKPKEMMGRAGYNPLRASWNYPMPWKGGKWTLRDIIDYDREAALAVLRHAARNRESWLKNFYTVFRKAVEPKKEPYAFVAPQKQWDRNALIEMLEILQTGRVEVHRARSDFTAEGRRFQKGDYVILMAQPAGAFAKTLLERQEYPEIRPSPNAPIRRPYDVTAHTLPLLMGVDVVEIDQPFDAKLELLKRLKRPRGLIRGTTTNYYLLRPQSNRLFLALNRLLAENVPAYRLAEELRRDGTRFAPGTVAVPAAHGSAVRKAAEAAGVDAVGIDGKLTASGYALRKPRIGLYQSWVPSMDEGWTRWVLEEYEYDYETLHDSDIRAGNLAQRFDVIILPSQGARTIIEGRDPKNTPPEYTGGIGEIGVANLREFVEAGGTLVALDAATELPIKRFWLPVRNVVQGLKRDEFFAPGAILRVIVDRGHPLGFGYRREEAVMFVNSPVFQGNGVKTVLSYPQTNPLLSGWLEGERILFGKSPLVEAPLGDGRVVLFGFRPQFRAQARSGYKFLFNAIHYAASSRTDIP
jgi:hypothetical protein